jgi:hypothetical protein
VLEKLFIGPVKGLDFLVSLLDFPGAFGDLPLKQIECVLQLLLAQYMRGCVQTDIQRGDYFPANF